MTTARSPGSNSRFPPAAVVADPHLDTVPGAGATQPVRPRTVVVAVVGEVDLSTSSLLRDGLLAHLRHSARLMVIDLTGVVFLGAAGLAVLVTVRDAAVAAGITLRLAARARPVLLPLRITGMDGTFDVFPTRAQALRGPEQMARLA